MKRTQIPFTNVFQLSTKKIVSVLFLLATVSIIRSIYGLLGKDDLIDEARTRVEELKREQAELIELQKKVGSPEFVEREARDRLGLAKEGEVVVILPSEDVLKHLAPPLEELEEYPEQDPIWRRWVRMFFTSGV
jgi:cell division protein FtsB